MSNQLDLAEIRARLGQSHNGRQFWRSLDELADTPEFQAWLAREFPRQMAAAAAATARSIKGDLTTRRSFLKLMGAALAMAGLAGCSPREPSETIVPYVNSPETIVPGKPLFFATAMPLSGYALGVLVENHMGRPTKIEGNPLHPASLGRTNALMQGSILDLYDPERAQVVTSQGEINTWNNFLDALNERLIGLQETGGAGLHILTGATTSPTLAAQFAAVLARFPQAKWHQYEPIAHDNAHAGAALVFGRAVAVRYDLSRAERILSLDADFLSQVPGSLRYAAEFMARRRPWTEAEGQVTDEIPAMNRLYVVESTHTITGAKADHRLPVRASQIESIARALARAVGVAGEVAEGAQLTEAQTRWVEAVARDLSASPGRSLVMVDETQPPVVHALGHLLNAALENVGSTVSYIEPVIMQPGAQVESLRALVAAMAAGQVTTLLILESNPVYTAPTDFAFAEQLAQVEFCVQASLYEDETTPLCHWHIPTTHYLESWGDIRGDDGTISIIQPLIAPLFESRTVHEILAALAGEGAEQSDYALVRAYWERYYNGLAEPPQPDFELFWRTALHDGVVAGTAAAPAEVAAQAANLPAPSPAVSGLELNFRPDSTIWDGRFANNVWLQELPKQITLLTWDNAALISPNTAAQLNLASQDLVDLVLNGRTLIAAVLVLPGQPDDAVTLSLGYGRAWADKVSAGLGFNAYALRTSDALWFAPGLEVRARGETYALATVQDHYSLEGRDHVRVATLAEYQEHPTFAQAQETVNLPAGEAVGEQGATGTGVERDEGPPPSFYPEFEYTGNAWAMTIDLGACIGCNACTIACQVENNIPTVGKEEVLIGREMHWIKVDRYFANGPDNTDIGEPEAYFQPRPCMHCEKAPCEPVCPVAATLHDSEGLNEMIYNRCVGTRYCSNNCPYKVRRFNFYDYTNDEIPLLAMPRNPDVTVRERGVMEKCTYCIQRINQARYEAAKENRPIADGEILTACQQACPTRAIIFGNQNDAGSLVSQLKELPLSYGMLEELGTQPRTTYLAAVRNPNPELEA